MPRAFASAAATGLPLSAPLGISAEDLAELSCADLWRLVGALRAAYDTLMSSPHSAQAEHAAEPLTDALFDAAFAVRDEANRRQPKTAEEAAQLGRVVLGHALWCCHEPAETAADAARLAAAASALPTH